MVNKDLTKDDIVHLSKLASLQLSDEELELFQSQLTETLHYVENLHELDTKSIPPTNHTMDQKNVTFEDGTKSERKLTQEEALFNAKEKKNNLFLVKRIM